MVSGKRQQFGLEQGNFNVGRFLLLQLLQLYGGFLQHVLAQQQSDGGDTASHAFVAGRRKAEQGFWRWVCHVDFT